MVFFFYPLDFTFVCPTEITAFSDRAEDFKKIGCEVLIPVYSYFTLWALTQESSSPSKAQAFQVVGASVDSEFVHLAWINTPREQGGLGPMAIPLVADLSQQIGKDYGCYVEDAGHTARYIQTCPCPR